MQWSSGARAFHSVMSDMGTLPERQRRALVLRELEGRSYDEIAVTLGVTGDGVRQLLNRARNSMRAAASALVPPALVGRIAGSQASVRIAELIDPPGTALMAKATAAVAAGAVALFAVTGPPTGDGGTVPRAEAGARPQAAQERHDALEPSTQAAASAEPVSEAQEQGATGPRREGRGDGQARKRRGAARTAAGPGPAQGGDDEGSEPAAGWHRPVAARTTTMRPRPDRQPARTTVTTTRRRPGHPPRATTEATTAPWPP